VGPKTGASQVAITESAARSLNLALQVQEVGRRDDLANAFRSARKSLMAPSPPTYQSSNLQNELAVNARTAKSLSLAMSPSVLVRADTLIE
jgi:hypothetical protein